VTFSTALPYQNGHLKTVNHETIPQLLSHSRIHQLAYMFCLHSYNT